MVKSWANDFVELYENDFSHKIDWEEVKNNTGMWVWKTEERDGWRYDYGANYFPKDGSYSELYEIRLKKTNVGFVKTKKEYKLYSMSGEKGDTRPPTPHIKRGEWTYNSFHR